MPRALFRLFGPTELEVMQVVWNYGGGSAREVYEAIRDRRPIAYTTVLTVLARLADKGLLAAEGARMPGYIYKPRLTKDELLIRAMREMLLDLQPTPLEQQQALAALAASTDVI
jgi:predicted transcriptional regulator